MQEAKMFATKSILSNKSSIRKGGNPPLLTYESRATSSGMQDLKQSIAQLNRNNSLDKVLAEVKEITKDLDFNEYKNNS